MLNQCCSKPQRHSSLKSNINYYLFINSEIKIRKRPLLCISDFWWMKKIDAEDDNDDRVNQAQLSLSKNMIIFKYYWFTFFTLHCSFFFLWMEINDQLMSSKENQRRRENMRLVLHKHTHTITTIRTIKNHLALAFMDMDTFSLFWLNINLSYF